MCFTPYPAGQKARERAAPEPGASGKVVRLAMWCHTVPLATDA